MIEPAGKRILVIDDANLIRRFYRDALEGAGFVVDEALNGVEALEKVLGETYDLAIVDVNMPQMDGLTFLKVLRRETTAVSSLPALVISTEASDQDVAAARAAGANFYLVKPVAEADLVSHACVLTGASL